MQKLYLGGQLDKFVLRQLGGAAELKKGRGVGGEVSVGVRGAAQVR